MDFNEDEITMLRMALMNSEPMDDSEEAARGALLQKLWDGRIALRKAKRDAEARPMRIFLVTEVIYGDEGNCHANAFATQEAADAFAKACRAENEDNGEYLCAQQTVQVRGWTHE